jgi:hypothetical protein
VSQDSNDLDLDSLDALLDAAEIEEVAVKEPTSVSAEDPESAMDDWGAALAEQTASPIVEPELTADPIATRAPMVTERPETPAPTSSPLPTEAPTQPVAEADQVLPKVENDAPRFSQRHATKNTETWTEAEMDSVKKLIIIFGSVSIILMLSTIGIGVSGLMSSGKTDPKLIETVENIKNDVEQAYLVTEDGNRQIKTMANQLAEAANQLAELVANLEEMKNKPVAAASVKESKAMTAAERKSAQREAMQAEGEAIETEGEKSEKSPSNAQVVAMSADIKDVKRRLLATQKLIEQIYKQSEQLQQQSTVLTEAVKTVDQDLKALKPAPKVIQAPAKPKPAPGVAETLKATVPAQPVKPEDDPQYRRNWSQQMGKTDGFP